VGLRSRVIDWLIDHRGDGNGIKGDMYDIARDTRAQPPEVTKTLWDLRQSGIVTFHERKGEGIDGHGSTTVLTDFYLTPKGRAIERAPIGFRLDDPGEAEPWQADDSPVGRLFELMKGGSLTISDANVRLGYPRKSTAIYAIAKSNPGGFAVGNGRVAYEGGNDWRPRANRNPKMAPRRSPLPPFVPPSPEFTIGVPMMREAKASVALDHDPEVGTQSLHPVSIVLPDLKPEMAALWKREQQRAQVAIAVEALESVGLDDAALLVLGAVPSDNPLEAEVIDFLKDIGYRSV
jgi:hypothetical protein